MSENGGRPPIPLERMLRIYFLQLWFNLSDPAVEEALYDSVAMRSFAGIDLGVEGAPDETTVYKFRHLLERNKLGKVLLGGNVCVGLEGNIYLERGVLATNIQLVACAREIIERMGVRSLPRREQELNLIFVRLDRSLCSHCYHTYMVSGATLRRTGSTTFIRPRLL